MRKNFYYFAFFSFFLFGFLKGNGQKRNWRPTIDLAGQWQFYIGKEGKDGFFNGEYNDTVSLPGTTDTNKKGFFNEDSTITFRLSRIYKYVGKAWYRKTVEIPNDWNGKVISLFLERTKVTQVWINGVFVGENNNISTSQVYDITKHLKPGMNEISIMVDNEAGVPAQVISSSHAYSEDTQTNWNGILGTLLLEAKNKTHISKVRVFPDVENKKATVEIEIANPELLNGTEKITLQASAWNTSRRHDLREKSIRIKKDEFSYALEYDMGKSPLLWSEFDPALYALTVQIKGVDKVETNFGLRNFETEKTQFTINGSTTFLRGKHDGGLFPLSGHIPMDIDSWKTYFQTLKDYGINYVRFHSWTPPQACFMAADITGIYLQPELPIWGSLKEDKPELTEFLRKEGVNILQEFGNHPSFVMFALGNEMSGDIGVMKDLVNAFKEKDPRLLYSYGSNNFLGYRGQIEGEDFLTTCRIGGGKDYETDVRASFSFVDEPRGGIMNNTYPNSKRDFSKAISKSTVPVISHETGQYQMYPNYDQIAKYTGVLRPTNLEIFHLRLKDAGMLMQANDFFEASGKWAALLYKADIEMELRTAKIGGYQLLDLQDFTGQGTALVGILDAFMENKGIISAAKWREFNNDVVPLFLTEKFTWTNHEDLTGEIKVANYSALGLKGKTLRWVIEDASGKVLNKGNFSIETNERGLLSVGTLNTSLQNVTTPKKFTIKSSISGSPYKNEQAIWVYPNEDIHANKYPDIYVSNRLDKETIGKLTKGGKVLLFPDKEMYQEQTVGGLFQTDYWNYGMFKRISEGAKKEVSPGTLGLLISDTHPLFSNFPTESHTSWQWYPIIKESYPLIMDGMRAGYKPLVQVIDNVERNHRLGLIFEFKVGDGKLMVCMSNLEAVKDKPEARQLYNSILHYMDSKEFNPRDELSPNDLYNLFNGIVIEKEIKGEKNISY